MPQGPRHQERPTLQPDAEHLEYAAGELGGRTQKLQPQQCPIEVPSPSSTSCEHQRRTIGWISKAGMTGKKKP
jgi:hypothetical protein